MARATPVQVPCSTLRSRLCALGPSLSDHDTIQARSHASAGLGLASLRPLRFAHWREAPRADVRWCLDAPRALAQCPWADPPHNADFRLPPRCEAPPGANIAASACYAAWLPPMRECSPPSWPHSGTSAPPHAPGAPERIERGPGTIRTRLSRNHTGLMSRRRGPSHSLKATQPSRLNTAFRFVYRYQAACSRGSNVQRDSPRHRLKTRFTSNVGTTSAPSEMWLFSA